MIMRTFIVSLLTICLLKQSNAQRRRPGGKQADTPSPTSEPADINIVYIWFDDLGAADVAYNGGPYPTPILDELANNDAIKLNWHYSDAICSASRSALLTGRYSWLTKVNTVVGSNSATNFMTDSGVTKTISEILYDAGYKTFIAGKWHLGFSDPLYTPMGHGFNQGLYTRFGNADYYVRGETKTVQSLDNSYGEPIRQLKIQRNQAGLGVEESIIIHDTFEIVDGVESAAFVGDTRFSDELFTTATREFIQNKRGSFPLFSYTSFRVPHSTIMDPPDTRADGSLMDYSECEDAFAPTACDDSTSEGLRCVYCKQVHYVSISIQEIIDDIKANSRFIDWSKTLIIITSDNGAQPEMDPDGRRGDVDAGSALPYRGSKRNVFEGGVRTPAILKGGLVEDILAGNAPALTNNMCEYDGIVHISDWYHILMDVTGVTDASYSPDDDHKDLSVWDNIKCKCGGSSASCDTDYPPRDEIIMMRLCGELDGKIENGTKYFHSTFIRQGDYKLVVNGSNTLVENCFNLTVYDEPNTEGSYRYSDGTGPLYPNQEYYDDIYLPRFTRNAAAAMKLYKSDCLDSLAAAGVLNDATTPEFDFSQYMLFDIGSDPIEACVVDDATKTQELLNTLLARSAEYVPRIPPSYVAPPEPTTTEPEPEPNRIFVAQMETFNCDTGIDYVITTPFSHINNRNLPAIDEIWRDVITIKEACNAAAGSAASIIAEETDQLEWNRKEEEFAKKVRNDVYVMLAIGGLIVFVLSMVIVYLTCGDGKIEQRRTKSVDNSGSEIQSAGDVEMVQTP